MYGYPSLVEAKQVTCCPPPSFCIPHALLSTFLFVLIILMVTAEGPRATFSYIDDDDDLSRGDPCNHNVRSALH